MKYKIEEIKQMKSHMFKRDSWLNVKTKVKDTKCSECKKLYKDIEDENIGLLIPIGDGNKHLCQACINKYIALGVEDLYVKHTNIKNEKESLISKILKVMDLSEYRVSKAKRYLSESSIEELNLCLNEETKEKEMRDYIKAIDSSNWILEEYLVEQYGVIMDKSYLKHESQIEDYFKDIGYEYMECGQGFYEDEAVKLVFIDGIFYRVVISAEIMSSKQDRGDRLYWVEKIDSVEYTKIDKPIEKITNSYNYSFSVVLLEEEKEQFDKLLKEYKIVYIEEGGN